MQSLVFQFEFNWTKRFLITMLDYVNYLKKKNIAEAQKGNIGILK